MKNILICLENVGIGGIETYTINQNKAFLNKVYNVFYYKKRNYIQNILKA